MGVTINNESTSSVEARMCDVNRVFFLFQRYRIVIVAQKGMSHAINSHVSTGKNPCINQAMHTLLMGGFCTLNICILDCHKN